MVDQDKLTGKRVLLVDDEPDILEALKEVLSMCVIKTASSFEESKHLLKYSNFDIAVLDIMGVDGYNLLEIAIKRNIIAGILTAHALSLKDALRSYRTGASFYIPKDKMPDIEVVLIDVLESIEQGRHPWWRWHERWLLF